MNQQSDLWRMMGSQIVHDAFCGMVLFLGAMGIFFQAVPDESRHILCQDGGFPAVVFTLPGHTVTVPILLDGIPGDLQRSSDLPLTRALQPHFANLFVNFHCDNHLYSPPT